MEDEIVVPEYTAVVNAEGLIVNAPAAEVVSAPAKPRKLSKVGITRKAHLSAAAEKKARKQSKASRRKNR